MLFRHFQFFDPGELIDHELELVPPQPQWIDDVVAACQHPLTIRDAPDEAHVSRHYIEQFVANHSSGRDPGEGSRVPQYHFWLRVRDSPIAGPPPLRIAGGIGLRVGSTPALEMYYGHIGYHVFPPARGNHYAERSCRLLLPLARRHGLRTLWITCNPDNLASRRTCERLGAALVDIVPVPHDNPLYLRGDHEKCRYRLCL